MKNGFTLLELMIVVAIIGILVSVGYVGIGDRMKKDKQNRVKVVLPTVIRNNIDRAFSEGREYQISIPTNGNGVLNVMKDAIGTGPAIQVESIDIPKGTITYVTSPASITSVIIGEKGEVSQDVDIIVKSGGKDYYKIEVNNVIGANIGTVRTYLNSSATASPNWIEESGK